MSTKKITPLCVILPKISGCVKTFGGLSSDKWSALWALNIGLETSFFRSLT